LALTLSLAMLLPAFAAAAGILPKGVDTKNFLQADAVLISWGELEAKLKDASQTLSQKLMDMKVFDLYEYLSVKLFVEKDGGILVNTLAELQEAAEDDAETKASIESLLLALSPEYFAPLIGPIPI